METKALVICGPTASGKTALAVSMAKRLQTEIISADCMLVYRGLDIGTAKPSLAEREGVLHHMIDVAEPTDSYSVSDYEKSGATRRRKFIAERKNARHLRRYGVLYQCAALCAKIRERAGRCRRAVKI